MAISFKSVSEVMSEIAERAKQERLAMNLTQAGLAKRSGVSLGSIKRFESTGQISLQSLLELASTLKCLDSFDKAFQTDVDVHYSLFTNRPVKTNYRKRGQLK